MSSRILHWPLAVGTTRRDGHVSVADPIGTILVVDDLKSSARLLERLLTRDGHCVRLAHDGREVTVEARDLTTDGHCQRLARYAVRLGLELGLPAEEIVALERGGFLHVIGKVGIPDAILLKPSRPTDAEFAIMKQHAVIGDRLRLPVASSAEPV